MAIKPGHDLMVPGWMPEAEGELDRRRMRCPWIPAGDLALAKRPPGQEITGDKTSERGQRLDALLRSTSSSHTQRRLSQPQASLSLIIYGIL